jgi:carbon storage regulator CsrA
MLILTRNCHEEIWIGFPGDPNHVVFRLIDVRGERARIGITADESIEIHRKEVAEKILEMRGEDTHHG